MLGFLKTKEKKPKNQAEAFAEFQQSIQAAISQARQAGVWPATLGDYLESHVNNLNMAQRR
jgi:hypothetical protein